MNESCPKQIRHIFENYNFWRDAYPHEHSEVRNYNLTLTVRALSDFELYGVLKGGISCDLQDIAYQELSERKHISFHEIDICNPCPKWFKINRKETETLSKKVNYIMNWLLESWRYLYVAQMRSLAKQLEKHRYNFHPLYQAIIHRQEKYEGCGDYERDSMEEASSSSDGIYSSDYDRGENL